jgi:AcrR family transcriptional regulator
VITKKRISSEERRERIIDAARTIFAERGFHGTTTRELAHGAEISEALMFKHFPNKQAIYEAMLSDCMKGQAGGEFKRILDLEPSTSTLAIFLHFLVTKVISGNAEARTLHRLLLRSLCEDGEFARVIFKHIGANIIPKMSACIDAAQAAGDLHDSDAILKCSSWLTQHLLLMISFMNVPDKRVVGYKIPAERFAEEAVIYCLRGIGLRNEPIERYYNPRALSLLLPEMSK